MADEPDGRERFKKLPPRIALEDTITEQAVTDPPEIYPSRDPEQDFFLRNAGG